MTYAIFGTPLFALLGVCICCYAYKYSAKQALLFTAFVYPFCYLVIYHSTTQALLFVAFLYSLRYLYWQLTTGASWRRLRRQHNCKPAYQWPSRDPFGIESFLQSWKALREHRSLEHIQHQFNSSNRKTGSIRLLNQEVLATIEPENVKSILSLDFKSYELGDERKRVMTPFLGEGIFTTDGPAWQHSRELLRPNFARAHLVENLEVFERHLQQLMRSIPKDGSPIDLQELFVGFTFDVATEFLLGESTNCLAPGVETERSAEFLKAYTYCQNTLEGKGDWAILGLFLPLPDARFERDCKVIHGFADDLIVKAVAKKPQPNEKARLTFLQQLTAETTDRIRIRSELLNLLLAGRDTTAALLTNVWFQLARHPKIEARLRKEINDTTGNQSPTFESLKSMKYLRAILSESLRLYPIVPEESRQAIRNTVLPIGGGDDEASPVFIKEGQIVCWSVYTMQRREDLYGEDAAIYKPERWLDEEDGKGSKGLRVGWEYVPFNGGPRICLGRMYPRPMTSDTEYPCPKESID